MNKKQIKTEETDTTVNKKSNKKKLIKTLVNIAGYAIIIICFIFIFFKFKKMNLSLLKEKINIFWIIWIAAFSFIYFLLFQIQGLTWNNNLEIISQRKTNLLEILAVYSSTNVAKYLPGNILVFVGRHLVLRKYGVSDIRLVLVNAAEIFFFLSVSVFISFIGFISGYIEMPGEILKNIDYRIIIIAAGVAVIAGITLIIIFNKKVINEFFTLLTFKNIIKIFFNILLYFSYFIFYGLLNVLIFKVFLNINISVTDIISIISIFSISWVLGYITPGASGGIGIRESVLMFMLSSMFLEEDIFLAAILSRLITLLGEIIAFIIGKIYSEYKGILKTREVFKS